MIILVRDHVSWEPTTLTEMASDDLRCDAIDQFLELCRVHLYGHEEKIELLGKYFDEISEKIEETVGMIVSTHYGADDPVVLEMLRERIRKHLKEIIRPIFNFACQLIFSFISIETTRNTVGPAICLTLLLKIYSKVVELLDDIWDALDDFGRGFRPRTPPGNPPPPPPLPAPEVSYREVFAVVATAVAAALLIIITIHPAARLGATVYSLISGQSIMPIGIIGGIVSAMFLSGEVNADVITEEVQNDPVYQDAEDQWIQDVYGEAVNIFCNQHSSEMEILISNLENDVPNACGRANGFHMELNQDIQDAIANGVSLNPMNWPCADSYNRFQIALDNHCEGNEPVPDDEIFIDDGGPGPSPTSQQDQE